MATYDNLPVYKATYDLLLLLFKACRDMQRDYRYTLGEALKKELIDLMTNIYRANCRAEKKELLGHATENIEVVRLQLRLCNELKQIPLKHFIVANQNVESISKQLHAWMKSCKN